eukprot:2132310-Prymnesium_polylepis.1
MELRVHDYGGPRPSEAGDVSVRRRLAPLHGRGNPRALGLPPGGPVPPHGPPRGLRDDDGGLPREPAR